MKTVYGTAPVYKIDGIPGYLAGEWPGVKSNKFGNTRRIIRQHSTGIIFDINDLPPISKSNNSIIKPTKELIYKPMKKMVKPFKNDKNIGYKVLVAAKLNDNTCILRKHLFESIEDYHREVQRRERKKKQTSILYNDFGIKTGSLNQQLYDNISNNKLLGVSIFKDSFDFMKKNKAKQRTINEFMKNSRLVMQLQEAKKNNSIQMEKKNLQKDIDYVTDLNFWPRENIKIKCN